MSEEDKMRTLIAEMKLYEAYLNDILTRETTVTRLMEEARLAIEAIKNISGQQQIETLTSVGIGVYAPASVSPESKLIVNIGAGVAVEKSRDDAINYVESHFKEMETALRSMMSQKQEIATRMEHARSQVNVMLQKMQKSGS